MRKVGKWIAFIVLVHLSFILLTFVLVKMIDLVDYFDLGRLTIIVYFLATPIFMFVFGGLIPFLLSLNFSLAPTINISKWIYLLIGFLHLVVMWISFVEISLLYFIVIAIPFIAMVVLSLLFISGNKS